MGNYDKGLRREDLLPPRRLSVLPQRLIIKESVRQFRRHWFDPWVGKIPWRREWQPTPIILPVNSHGQKSLVGYTPWDPKESDMTEH